jgi:hypothetical protein
LREHNRRRAGRATIVVDDIDDAELFDHEAGASDTGAVDGIWHCRLEPTETQITFGE